ncbi:hypothetical protein ACIBKZ_02765 [Streptomyces sp. NPDC050421]|uniref:hypothetical protein n=1 Tax=Streptomyces sp. NPDC050421 TaxID=3365613 RepID=UPI003795CF02
MRPSPVRRSRYGTYQDVRIRRLVDRHVRFGKPRPHEERWVGGSDEANARLVAAGRDRTDLVVRLTNGTLP